MNDHEKNLPRLLAALDAAPVRELTEAESNRKEHLLRTVMSSATSVSQPTAPPGRRRPWLWVAAGAVTATAAVAVVAQAPHSASGSGPLPAAELASWTGTPSRPSATSPEATAAEKWCVKALSSDYSGKPVSYANLDVRGSITSVVVTDGKTTSYCLTDKAGHGMAEVIDPVKKLAGNAVEVDSAGGHGEGSTGLNYMEGSVGSDVRAVTLHDGGRTIEATIQNNRFTAWWPSAEPSGSADKVDITLKNGSTRTVTGDSIFPKD
ncbi:hypothetical protein [Streptomyces carpinensis]|uniref:Uncharacterized protein n=1 Tax=Streptomyces carpinensis TaxID=66369 RepID=A0ABV1W6Q9_9ACTN|nr:hypothetical protein [Streptomyces carpinensis]